MDWLSRSELGFPVEACQKVWLSEWPKALLKG
jgi:hypothetical protein